MGTGTDLAAVVAAISLAGLLLAAGALKLRVFFSSLVILAAFTFAYCYGVSIPDGELGPGNVLVVIGAASMGALRVIGWTR